MKLTKDVYIHNRLFLEATEKDILKAAYDIISRVQAENIQGVGMGDAYLDEQCTNAIRSINELLDDYHNSYLNN